MGDRWNINNDEAEARRYREEVPLSRRILNDVVFYGLVIGIPALLFAAMFYGSR